MPRCPIPDIIANPNCSTIQMVVALKPIYDAVGIKQDRRNHLPGGFGHRQEGHRGTAAPGCRHLRPVRKPKRKIYPHQIAFNCFPHIGAFLDNGFTEEEMKMVNETRKIFEDPEIRGLRDHRAGTGFLRPFGIGEHRDEKAHFGGEVRRLLEAAPGVKVVDDPSKAPIRCRWMPPVRMTRFVGRIRLDPSVENGLAMWVVADNIRKGAASNAVQIAETLMAADRL